MSQTNQGSITWKIVASVLGTIVLALGSGFLADIRVTTKENTVAIGRLTIITTELANEMKLRVAGSDDLHARLLRNDERLTAAVADLELLLKVHLKHP